MKDQEENFSPEHHLPKILSLAGDMVLGVERRHMLGGDRVQVSKIGLSR